MLIAHMPAGYILSVAALGLRNSTRNHTHKHTRLCLYTGLLGSILPDFDILYWFFIDDGHTFHHAYWTHIPLYWAALAVLLWLLRGKLTEAVRAAAPFVLMGVAAHLVLDSVASGIMWFYPFSREMLHTTEIPVRYGHWLIDMLTHWTFFIELAICALGGLVFLYRLVSGQHSGVAARGCLGLAPCGGEDSGTEST